MVVSNMIFSADSYIDIYTAIASFARVFWVTSILSNTINSIDTTPSKPSESLVG
jgi:hypothetical protein